MVNLSESQPQHCAFECCGKIICLIKNSPVWSMGDGNGALVHSAVNEYLAIDTNGNYTWITHGFGKVKRYIKTAYYYFY